ncbi:hypothetical protein Pcinc_005328 [Petrolisthes cinctipes]|uniref:Large ribosomal subunit protein eL28 n=1 Tax=Petrolisthes cinctipes TaxID=88211 RepID=A0AAE1GDT6_PETCI|nr:hypothetical protein Pcinc_005328 [Petrolisthes cinctipes]
MKRRDVGKPFSTEPFNLKNVHSPRYTGLCKQRVLGVDPAKDGKGIVFSFRTKKHKNKPGKNICKTTIKSDPRKTLLTVKNFINKNNYRKDLRMAALRRTSAILRSQQAQPFRKIRGRRGRRDRVAPVKTKKPQ